MAEFQVFIERFRRNDASFVDLYKQLENQEQECVRNIDEISLKVPDFKQIVGTSQCHKDKKDFDSYFQAFQEQFVENGKKICMKAISDEKQRLLETNESSEKPTAKLSCLKLYHGNILLFKDHTMKKLQTLVNKTAVDQL